MKKLKTCSECGQKTSHLRNEQYATEIKHDGKAYLVTVEDVPVYRCSECGALAITDAADEAVSRELRRVAGLMTPEEIREGRRSLGMTQKQLAERLKVAEATLCRWETGGQIQQAALNGLMWRYFHLPEFRKLWDESPMSVCPLDSTLPKPKIEWACVLQDERDVFCRSAAVTDVTSTSHQGLLSEDLSSFGTASA